MSTTSDRAHSAATRIVSMILALLLATPTGAVFAQENDDPSDAPPAPREVDPTERAILAMSTPDYPVTPGDRYLLRYVRGSRMETLDLIVEQDYQINMGIFGTLEAVGMTFPEVRERIQEEVRDAYAGAAPRLTIERVGRFHVLLRGEVGRARYVEVSGLDRLSDALDGRVTDYASERRVTVVPEGEADRREHDLFLARRDGAMEEDPYLRPGDVIEVPRADRRVRISGQVHRSGEYQLLAGETLEELIERYGDGMTRRGDRGRIEIERVPEDPDRSSERFTVDLREVEPSEVTLEDEDAVSIRTREEYRPRFMVEGAVRTQEQLEAVGTDEGAQTNPFSLAGTQTPGRVRTRVSEGERLSEALRRVDGNILPAAERNSALLIRADGSEHGPVDIDRLLSERDPDDDVVLEPDDRLYIPFRQQFVTVTGGVRSPGRFPYMPGRSYEYYLNLAGGRDPDRALTRTPVITDQHNERRSPDDLIETEDRIHLRENHPFRWLGQTLTIVSTALTIGTTIYQLTSGE